MPGFFLTAIMPGPLQLPAIVLPTLFGYWFLYWVALSIAAKFKKYRSPGGN
jgi:hypothetical protein